jgi:hypothetical protein
MVNVGVFYGLFKYFMAIWYNLWPFGIVCGHLLYFTNLVCLDQEKSGNPGTFTSWSWVQSQEGIQNALNIGSKFISLLQKMSNGGQQVGAQALVLV